jgi:FtsZ-binding cell division protein ZapB
MNRKNKDVEQMSLANAEEAEILARLTDRVEKAIATIQELRRERDSLKARLDDAESKLREQSDTSDRLGAVEEEYDRFKKERSEIRDRIESILANLESLDEASDEAVAE